MNPENNNMGNGFGEQQFNGIDQLNQMPTTPDASQNTMPPIDNSQMPVSDETFSPFENLNNEALNVPTEQFNPTPVDPSSFNAEVNNDINAEAPVSNDANQFVTSPEVQQPGVVTPEVVSEPSVMNQEPVQDFTFQQPDSIDSTVAPEQLEPVQEVLTPQVDNLTNSDINQTLSTPDAPVQTETLNVEPQVEASVTPDANLNVASNPAPEMQGPTIPIPDSMPTNDYQATVSTPVDYATPMSDFDQIGTTPEIDPKAKTKKVDTKKTLMFVAIILLVAALGAGAYYLINIKGIFNSTKVETKELTVDSGTTLSTNIDDYAKFNNTSSSNCTLDTSKVDMSKAGKYTYTVSCGDEKYEGTVVVVDKTAPDVELNFRYTVAPQILYKEDIVRRLSEENAEYDFTNEEEAKAAFSNPGLNIVSITAKDSSNNSKEVFAPIAVLTSDYQFILVSFKDTENPNIKEKVVAYIGSDVTVQVAVKMYVITFDSAEAYKEAVKDYDGGKEFTYGDYKGLPIFYESSNKLVILTDQTMDIVGQQGTPVYNNLTQNGYNVTIIRQQDTDHSLVNFDSVK